MHGRDLQCLPWQQQMMGSHAESPPAAIKRQEDRRCLRVPPSTTKHGEDLQCLPQQQRERPAVSPSAAIQCLHLLQNMRVTGSAFEAAANLGSHAESPAHSSNEAHEDMHCLHLSTGKGGRSHSATRHKESELPAAARHATESSPLQIITAYAPGPITITQI